MLDHAELLSWLSYDPETGVFRWLRKPNRNIVIGSIAGCPRSAARGRGDVGIRINGQQYSAHRLAWFYVHGVWPSSQIDHKNCDASDNRLENLREATASQNQGNKRRCAVNRSGVKGVCWHAREKRWYASIRIKGKSRHLGRFVDIEDARVAYWVMATWYHGDFARFA